MSSVTTTPPTLPAFDHEPAPYTGPGKAEVLAMRQQYLSPALFLYYQSEHVDAEGAAP